MVEYRFQLEKYKGPKTRHVCPQCESKKKTFAYYIDRETNLPVNHTVGRCERLDNCGYHYTPKEYFTAKGINQSFEPYIPKKPEPVKPASYIDAKTFKASLAAYEKNNFIIFLYSLFDRDTVRKLIGEYFIGSSKQWGSATIFWQIDLKGKIRSGKIMAYDSKTGKRQKDCTTWVHKFVNEPDFNLSQCLFGEHLLKDKIKPVALVESEKTAIIASVYLPEFIWLACGSKTGLSARKLKVLSGRTVILYPDLNAFSDWNLKAREYGFKISSILEANATEADRIQGLDIADYLIKIKPETKQRAAPVPIPQPVLTPAPLKQQTPAAKPIPKEPEPTPKLWNLNFSFDNLPAGPVRLSHCEAIHDLPKFIDTHLQICRRNNGNPYYEPYYIRLQKLEQIIGNKQHQFSESRTGSLTSSSLSI